MDEEAKNTFREIWREREDDFYADSIFVTDNGAIGINCGGFVIIRTLQDWHRMAMENIKQEQEQENNNESIPMRSDKRLH